MIKRSATVLLASSLLAGCVVFPYGPYWRPEVLTRGVNVDYAQAWCGEKVGPLTKARVRLDDGTRLELRIEEKPQPMVFVLVNIAQAPAEFGAVQRFTANGQAIEVPTVLRRSVYANGKLDTQYGGSRFVGPDERAGLALQVPIPESIRGDFVYETPVIRRGDRLDSIQVRFERRRLDGGVQPFNC